MVWMTSDRLMRIHDPEFLAKGERVFGAEFTLMSERVLHVAELTSRLNVLPFEDEAGKAACSNRYWAVRCRQGSPSTRPFTPTMACVWSWPSGCSSTRAARFWTMPVSGWGRASWLVPKATFITVGHPVDPPERSRFLTGAPIDVADNVWIGAGATILPGVRIGRDAVVAAGAVVVDDVPAASLVAGPKAAVRRRGSHWSAVGTAGR